MNQISFTWRVATFATLTSVVVLAPASVGYACSICRCGDATFNALGKDGYAARGFRIAIDWERFDKDEGDPAVATESQVENRFTALASYGFNDRITLFARIPYSERELTMSPAGAESETIRTSGFSDPEIYGQVRLWSSGFASSVGRRASVSLNAGLKLPWGQNGLERDGVRADEHAQPGTGSTDVFGSLAWLYLVDKQSALFVSTGIRHTGGNRFGYRYGSSLIANLAYEHKLARVLDGVLELNYRQARKDRLDADGTTGEDTGGSLLYLTPRLLVSLGRGIVLRAASQIPVARGLNGIQKERAVANLGLTYLFPH